MKGFSALETKGKTGETGREKKLYLPKETGLSDGCRL